MLHMYEIIKNKLMELKKELLILPEGVSHEDSPHVKNKLLKKNMGNAIKKYALWRFKDLAINSKTIFNIYIEFLKDVKKYEEPKKNKETYCSY